MAGLQQTFTLTDQGLEAQLDALIARGGNLTPAFDDIGEDMIAVTINAFEKSQSPEGVPWLPSAAAKAEGRKTLIDQGMRGGLEGSFGRIPGPTGVVYGTNVVYAAIHQFGGSFAHHGRSKGADQGTGFGSVFASALVSLPARPFIGASDKDIARWEGTLRDYLTGDEPGAPA